MKGKYKKILMQQEIPDKSMIIKWNNKRAGLFNEVELNKSKMNRGNIREARQRRKVPASKSDTAEQYPRASKLIMAEFKLIDVREGAKYPSYGFVKR